MGLWGQTWFKEWGRNYTMTSRKYRTMVRSERREDVRRIEEIVTETIQRKKKDYVMTEGRNGLTWIEKSGW